jgi:hypothetical protein
MEINEQFIRKLIGAYLKNRILKSDPSSYEQSVKKNNSLFIGQDLISIDEATKRYNLSRGTLYNYHQRRFITLCGSNEKDFFCLYQNLKGMYVVIQSPGRAILKRLIAIQS